MSVLTHVYGQVTNEVVTECEVFMQSDDSKLPQMHTTAHYTVWDTGATNTIISPKIVKELGLKPFDTSGISGIGGYVETQLYKIGIILPNGLIIKELVVLESEMDFDMIIGMDVITLGDFCFSNKDGVSVFSFRLPSKEHIVLRD